MGYGDAPGSDRPAKRIKHTHHLDQHLPIDASANANVNVSFNASHIDVDVTGSMTMPMTAVPPPDSAWVSTVHNSTSTAPVLISAASVTTAPPPDAGRWYYDASRQWLPPPQSSSFSALPADSEMFYLVQPGHLESISPGAPATILADPASSATFPLVPSVPELDLNTPDVYSQSLEQGRHRRLLPAASDELDDDVELLPRKPSGNEVHSPFRDCLNSFGRFSEPRWSRPDGSAINGYIKVRWRQNEKLPYHTSTVYPSNFVIPPTKPLVGPPRPSSMIGPMSSPVTAEYPIIWSQASPSLPPHSTYQQMTEPQRPLPQFGLFARMDRVELRCWEFYIHNWCPGRSILKDTNLWLKDFAAQHSSEGVLAAIQSLAGIYIHDYTGTAEVRERVNERFSVAEARLTELLNEPMSEQNADEIITIACLLSMQDVVLVGRRLKKPHQPRWLQGFGQAELFLQANDPGARFWRPDNIQISALRASQSVVVGRAIITTNTMLPLLAPTELKPEKEQARFGWLLYGNEADMYAIHGGCGFSKKLLHIIHQITYCAARLQQEPKSIFVPSIAKMLYQELVEMRQWTNDTGSDQNPRSKKAEPLPSAVAWAKAKAAPPTIEGVRNLPRGWIIQTDEDMTNITAEAWRIAIIVYLQCRLQRLPRNHPEVINNMSDLASCIRIMPTSGSQFTAQAPLFPVFLLGMLATNEDHRSLSRDWFDQVVNTPVRSSVPPLYEALKRIWMWIDVDVKLPTPEDILSLPETIGTRPSWWEQFVARVDRKEPEVLCLT